MGMHPFRIQSTVNGSVGPQYNNGVTNNDVSNGTLTFNVPMDVPEILYYQCTAHASMGGPIYILDQNPISASYAATASYAYNAISASYATFASTATSASYATTASYVLNAISASYATTASSADDFLVRGTLTAQTIVAQIITSSVNFVTGSTHFGSIITNTHQFTGSVSVSGSITVGNSVINDLTASYAQTASYAFNASNATSASFATSAISASIAANAVTSSLALNANTASYALNAVSSSYAATASYVANASSFPFTGSAQITGSLGVTGSISIQGSGSNLFTIDGTLGRMFTIDDTISGSIFSVSTGSLAILEIFSDKKINMSGSVTITGSLNVTTGITGSLLGTASWAQNVITASYILNAVSASYATTSSYAYNAISASFATSAANATTASYILNAASASYALTASFALNGGGGGGSSTIYVLDEGVNQGSASFFNFVGAGVAATVTNGTASVSISGGGGGGVINVLDEGVSQGSASFFNFTGAGVTATVTNGTASLSIPGATVNGSNVILVQAIAATTWSFYHNLGEQFPVFTIFDSNNDVIMPARINAENSNTASIYWSTPTSGKAVAANCGFSGSVPSALTASYATNFTIANTLIFDQTLTDYSTVTSSISGSNNLFTQATGSYTSAFFKYTVSSGSNARAGEVMTVWNGTATTYTDISTTDIGNTSAVTSSTAIVGSDIQFNIYTGTSGWKLKSLATYM